MHLQRSDGAAAMPTAHHSPILQHAKKVPSSAGRNLEKGSDWSAAVPRLLLRLLRSIQRYANSPLPTSNMQRKDICPC